MRLAIAISPLLALLYVLGQPMPPKLASRAAAVSAPATFERFASWEINGGGVVTNTSLSISNAATNYTVNLPATAREHPVRVVLGDTRLRVEASGPGGKSAWATNWNFSTENRVKLTLTPSGWSAMTNVNGLPATNQAGALVPLAVPSLLTLTNGRGI